MNIQPLFSTKQRELIMNYLLDNPNEEINMNRIARKLSISPAQMHKYIEILRQENLVQNKKLLITPLINSLRLTRNLSKISNLNIIKILQKHFPKAIGIGIYGSWAKGVNDETADLDIWLKITKLPKDIEIVKARREIEQKIGKAVDITILNQERMSQLQERNASFYFSLYHGITLWGEGL